MLYVGYVFFSCLEFMSILFFGITFFKVRIRAKAYIKLFILCVFLSLLSFIFRYENILQNVAPFVFMAIMMVSMKPIIQYQIKTSLVVGSIPYLIYGLYNALFIKIYSLITDSSVITNGFSHTINLLMLLCSLSFFTIGLTIRFITRDGITFDPDDSEGKTLKYTNTKIALAVVLTIILEYIGFRMLKSTSLPFYFNTLLVIMLITTIAIIFLLNRRDKEEAILDYNNVISRLSLKEVKENEKTS